ncbi:MAG: type II toxin-antitoxin system prevent-host-death family antitoxin [Spirochaetales bacterium]|jgi:prevent-host-death family protein|nr:type II toxin-antitoxin system prevent-host-death family antitoxin [Spirochaetales bacterium]
MPIIRPISDIRNKFNLISEVCHREQEPVFLTKNGQGDLVVMSIELYEKQQTLIDLYQKLGEAEDESNKDSSKISHKDLMLKLRKKINA